MNETNNALSATNQSATSIEALSDDQLKKLYRHAIALNIFGVIFLLWAVLCFIFFILACFGVLDKDRLGPMLGCSISAIFFGFLGYGTLVKIPAARIISIILFSFLLLGIPIGTVIGILGLMTYVGSGSKLLFGKSGINRKELIPELKKRELYPSSWIEKATIFFYK